MVKYYHELHREKYDIILIVREEVRKIIEYFTNDIVISVIYINMIKWDQLKILDKIKIKPNDDDLLLTHGYQDSARCDKYKNVFHENFKNCRNFVKLFYESYELDYNIRYEYFIFERNINVENDRYNDFIDKYGENYVLFHDNEKRFFNIQTMSNYPQINLNQISDTMFDYIKILENSRELHLLDSVWGAFCYLLDAKYSLFKHIKVYIYIIRGHVKMFTEPVKLDNWIIM